MKFKKKIATSLIAFTFVFAIFLLPFSVQATTIYKGVDVYEHSDISNYQQLKDSDIQVVIQKASQGLTYNDSLLQYRASMLPKYGFKVGYYHFAQYNSTNPIEEAQHFLSRIQGLHSDTVLFLDIEDGDPKKGEVWNNSTAISYVNSFIEYVQSKGYKIGIYSGQSFYYEKLQGHIQNVPLWIASYGKQPLQFPNVVSWQYSGTGSNQGISGYVDMDYFNDSIFTGQAPTVENNAPVQNVSNTQYYNGYNMSKAKSLQHLLNGLKLANLTEDGKLGTQTLNAMSKLPIAQYSHYHNDAYTDWLESQLGQPQDHIFGKIMANKVYTFQKSKGLKADSEVGINTLKELLK